jgi:hypothetical protein
MRGRAVCRVVARVFICRSCLSTNFRLIRLGRYFQSESEGKELECSTRPRQTRALVTEPELPMNWNARKDKSWPWRTMDAREEVATKRVCRAFSMNASVELPAPAA